MTHTSPAAPIARERRSYAVPAFVALFTVLVVPALALAHAVVFPRESAAGAYEKYVLRVPNERDVATTAVEMRFPADVRVISFSEVQGWRLQVLTDSAQRITGAIWTGNLPAARFVEFPFMAVNPDADATIVWPAYQTYADGERLEWTGPEGSRSPASVTVIRAALGAGAGAGASAGAAAAGSPVALYTAIGAAVLALISLGLAMRPRGDS